MEEGGEGSWNVYSLYHLKVFFLSVSCRVLYFILLVAVVWDIFFFYMFFLAIWMVCGGKMDRFW